MSDPLVTPWTIPHQASLFKGSNRQEYGSGLSFPSSRDLSDPGIKPASPALADRLLTIELLEKAAKNGKVYTKMIKI